MGADKDSASPLRGEIGQQAPNLAHPFGIEAVERLVQKQHVGSPDQGKRQSEALLHTEGVALGDIPGYLFKPHSLHHLGHRRPWGRAAPGPAPAPSHSETP